MKLTLQGCPQSFCWAPEMAPQKPGRVAWGGRVGASCSDPSLSFLRAVSLEARDAVSARFAAPQV